MKTKLLLISILFIILASCKTMGVYDGKTFKDPQGIEYKLDYWFNGLYFLEIKDSTGTWKPDNQYQKQQMKNDSLKRNLVL